ncbi:MAG: 3-methyl-2-oxobutanoate hydroxymethyltransferase [Leptolyngbya foveolarum]|uniref:3-methyl-2-oxobutanoate hydroxymethyltransferase n=1 Tax=Leptolyngbya foveolarum TaxID=47253 RepID=A0A2W4U9H2_9CYAN|nr:MAG: 3-methyl-2-oxobutanoate hydroxymethyltransferase [Leptolyngbya foveolarum]
MIVNVHQFVQWKEEGTAIAVLTAWDYLSAQMVNAGGADIVLVGDSMAMPVIGHETTLPITLDEMIYHAKMVRRAIKNTLVVVDLPFLSYQTSLEAALMSAGRVLKETGAQAVKMEGGHASMVEKIAATVQVGIPVMGHVGLTPQSVYQFGSFRKQGKSDEDAKRILGEAIALEKAGVFAIVLEHIPADLAHKISQRMTIPTIGIGAGPDCDGQVLVTSDLLGLSDWQPPFAKPYVNLREQGITAIQQFCENVHGHKF